MESEDGSIPGVGGGTAAGGVTELGEGSGLGGGAGTALALDDDRGFFARPCRIGRGREERLIGPESAPNRARVNW